jgi:hypothetical protein
MKRNPVAAGLAIALGLSLLGGAASAQTVRTRLVGYQEVPAISSPNSGEFRAKIDRDPGTIYYELEYGGPQGNAVQSHIHVG